jgi:hypothetical protein
MIFVLSVACCSKKSLLCSEAHFLFSCIVGAVVLTSGGCRESSNTVSVHGSVTYRGKALTNAALMFFPATGRPTSVVISSDGNYSAELPPGDYVVTVNVGADLPPGYKEGDPLPPPKFILPDEYTSRAKSTLQATVAADQSAPIDFELE